MEHETIDKGELVRNLELHMQNLRLGETVLLMEAGEVIGGLLPAKNLIEYESLKNRQTKSLLVTELSNDQIAMIEKSVYGEVIN